MNTNAALNPTAIIEQLKKKHRSLREHSPPALNLRVHRALSWMARADREAGTDHDAAFIFYWIAFNAIYARDVSAESGGQTRDAFSDFFEKLVTHDTGWRIYQAIWKKFSGLKHAGRQTWITFYHQ